MFDKLGGESQASKAYWVAQAWVAETLLERGQGTKSKEKFKEIAAARTPYAADGVRLVKFFELRRAVDAAGDVKAFALAAAQAKAWLDQYGTGPKPGPEVLAVRYYRATLLKAQAEVAVKPNPVTRVPEIPESARVQLKEAEKLYRDLAQGDGDYTERAARHRMRVVRLLIGEADKAPTEYATFDDAQQAALVQITKLNDLDAGLTRAGAAADAVAAAAGGRAVALADDAVRTVLLRHQQARVIAFLERARELATDKDHRADVGDVLARLVYFYQVSEQGYQAAVFGEHVARLGRAAGKAAAPAGDAALAGYAGAAARIPDGAAGRAELVKADRARAIGLGKYLDEKFPTDPATDRARHRLGGILYEDDRAAEAFDVLTRIRPGYDRVVDARQLEAAVAQKLLGAKGDAPPPAGTAPKLDKAGVFRKVVADLNQVPSPSPAAATAADARGYLTLRCRVGMLHLVEGRVFPERETEGYAAAVKEADAVLTTLPKYPALLSEKVVNAEGMEVRLLAEDVRTRAFLLRGQRLFNAKKYPEAVEALEPVLKEMADRGKWADEVGKVPGIDADERKGKLDVLAAGVDNLRRGAAVLGLNARIKLGEIDKAAAMLDLLKKFGGNTVDAATLRELAVGVSQQVKALRRAGSADEANALADQLVALMTKVSADPKLPTNVHVLIGNALAAVGRPGPAVEALDRALPKLDKGVFRKPAGTLSEDEQKAVGLYKAVALYKLRALRQDPKLHPQADAILLEMLGDPKDAKPQGLASTSLEFIKEAAFLKEAKAEALADPKAAIKFWADAIKDWNRIKAGAQARLQGAPPVDANGQPDEQAIRRNKNAFFDADFDVQRCLYKATVHAQKDKVGKVTGDVAGRFVQAEKGNEAVFNEDVKARFTDLLDEYKDLKAAYQAAGGKLFLQP